MSTTTQVRKKVRADGSPFEMPALTSGYPLDVAEKTAIVQLLRHSQADEAKSGDEEPESDAGR